MRCAANDGALRIETSDDCPLWRKRVDRAPSDKIGTINATLDTARATILQRTARVLAHLCTVSSIDLSFRSSPSSGRVLNSCHDLTRTMSSCGQMGGLTADTYEHEVSNASMNLYFIPFRTSFLD
jgi:hypothetical protein